MRSIGSLLHQLRRKIREDTIEYKFKKSIVTHAPIIVYQMGKVGSMSIYNSLKEQYRGTVLHRHVLNAVDDWQDGFLFQLIVEKGLPLRLISLMREPVGRNISAFFQNFEVITGIKPQDSKFSQTELNTIYFTSPKMDHNVPLTWFNENIKKHFGIDIYSEPFPKEKGWAVLKKGNIELLLLKAEINDVKKVSLVKNFTGIKDFKLTATNIGEDKGYATIYASFKKNIQFPPGYINKLYTSSEIKYFYTDDEIKGMREKWRPINHIL